jgi:hypothetical protein
MAKPAITLRSATAPSPLTYAQLDQNFTNLKDATISLDAGTGGTTVTTDLNGKITLVAGTGITLTGDNTAKTLTITNSSLGANSFGKIVVSGQSDVDADSTGDTLTLVAGAGISITTSAGSDSVTIEASGAAGTGTVNGGISGRLTYYPSTGTTVDDVPNLNYDGTNNIFNVFSVLKAVPASSATPNIDGVPGAIPLATDGSTKDFPDFSGLIIVNNHSTGNVALWLCGGSSATKVSDSVSNTSGTVTYVSGIDGYRWTNNTGGTINVTFFSLRLREAA